MLCTETLPVPPTPVIDEQLVSSTDRVQCEDRDVPVTTSGE